MASVFKLLVDMECSRCGSHPYGLTVLVSDLSTDSWELTCEKVRSLLVERGWYALGGGGVTEYVCGSCVDKALAVSEDLAASSSESVVSEDLAASSSESVVVPSPVSPPSHPPRPIPESVDELSDGIPTGCDRQWVRIR